MIKSPYCRQGNKLKLLKDIIKYVPEHKIYCEPFTGSGAVFFNLPKAKKSILNDLDKDVYNILKIIQRAPLDNEKYVHDLNTLNKIKSFYDNHSNSIEDLLFYYKILLCNGFGGNPVGKSSQIYTEGNPDNILKNLEYYKSMLKNVIITNKDYIDIVLKYDSPDTFFFIDPPYENTSKGFYSNSSIDFEQLCNILKSIKGLFLLSINDSPYIRKLFKGFIIKKINVRSDWNNKTGGKLNRKELFIMNYTL